MKHVVALARRGALLEYLEPARTDNHQYGRALRERLIDGLGKVLTWSDVFNVHEDMRGAYAGAEVIGDAAGVGSCVITPIADEDVVRGGGLVEEDFRRFPRLVPIGLFLTVTIRYFNVVGSRVPGI